MSGYIIETLKRTPSLIPLFVAVGCGVAAGTLYPLRCALKSPDVTWSRNKNPEPWNDYKNKQYKFFQSDKVPKSSPIPEY